MRYLIIGNSAAGIFAAETIRGLDPQGRITMISKENTVPYSRCLTSYYLGREIPVERMYIRNTDFYEALGIEFLGDTAVQVEAGERRVLTQSGRVVPYDKLLIATGAAPVRPPLEGMDMEGVFQLRTLEDAQAIVRYAEEDRREEESGDAEQETERVQEVVVIGAGLVGLKAAHGLHERGLKVTVVEFADQIMPQSLDTTAAQIIQRVLESHGYRLILQEKVVKIQGRPSTYGRQAVSGVVLSSGERISCRMVVMAVGVRPETGLVAGSSMAVKQGIIVNERMETSLQDVYAAGDVAEGYDFLWESLRINALWPVATSQGVVAGCNMTGLKRVHEGSMSLNSADFYGVGVISAGILHPREEHEQVLNFLEPRMNQYRRLVLREGRLVGMLIVGEVRGAGVLTGLIRKKAKVGETVMEWLKGSGGHPAYVPGRERGEV
ncbi:MAG: FAD-dependent oxidoreductase [Desulfitobacteriaceae bacterium]|nr:FAD-dependent oxidoreductase [Desulfitobacteriaceae bacterium]MDI6913435.1 FAD-dependent oxidoreductase [Desulfitobacteriaceae bacterium]